MKFKSITGTRDVLPEEQPYWRIIEKKINEITALNGYARVDPPLLEATDLFIRGVGDTTDIVEKEMYTFKDKGNKSLTLRPEFTAGVLRLYLENGLFMRPKPVKLFSIGPIFRYEKPQAGRFRQHTQFNVEALGEQDPSIDLEVMSIAWQLYAELGFRELAFQLNSTGCPKCRPRYIEILKKYYQNHIEKICTDCKRRMDRNALRLLDCKKNQCKPIIETAPVISEYLCEECEQHFTTLRRYLKLVGRPYTINHTLVRGLDYYTKTVFEVWAQGIGAQNAMCGGGRYDGLIEQFGGQPTPGIGFGSGIERIILSMQEQGLIPPATPLPKVFVIHTGQKARESAITLVNSLRRQKIATLLAFGERSFRSQMREANRHDVRFAVIIGDRECAEGIITLKDMATGDQNEIAMDQAISYLSGLIEDQG